MNVVAGTYVYCVSSAQSFGQGSSTFTTPGIGGHGAVVRIIAEGDLAAVVSDSAAVHYDVSRENLLAHQRVLEEAMAQSDILPVAFGTVAANDDEVREALLRREADHLHANLDYIRGCVELALRALWQPERLFEEIVAEDDEIRALRDGIASYPEAATEFDRIRLGELTEWVINAKSDVEAEAILGELQPIAVDTVLNPIVTEMMILNAAFLVERTRVPEFDVAVQEIGASHAERLSFQYVGPLPPFNFVDASVNWED